MPLIPGKPSFKATNLPNIVLGSGLNYWGQKDKEENHSSALKDLGVQMGSHGKEVTIGQGDLEEVDSQNPPREMTLLQIVRTFQQPSNNIHPGEVARG